MSLAEAVHLVLNHWEAFSLAKQMGWGGIDTEEKAEWFHCVLVEWIEANGADPDDIEDILLQIMQDEFNSLLEDGSAKKVASECCRLFKQLSVGDLSGLEKLRLTNKKKCQFVAVDKDDKKDSDNETPEDENPPLPSIVNSETDKKSSKKTKNRIDADGWQLV
jgi:pre-rRNA-processing protein TSR2